MGHAMKIKIHHPIVFFALGLAVLLSLTACRTEKHATATYAPQFTPATTSFTTTNQLDPSLLRPSNRPFTLGPGDHLDLELAGEPTNQTAIVSPDGKIYFNILPGIDVWGLTLGQTKAKLEQELGQYVRNGPKVSVSLRSVQSQRVWILGRVGKPGVYPLAGSLRLLEALSLAGGPAASYSISASSGASGISLNLSASGDETCDLRRAILIRQGHLVPVDFEKLMGEGDLSQNIYLQPDDFIYVPSAAGREVYVLGAVTLPHAVAYNNGMTLVHAVASAGGTIKDAYLSHVAIVHGSFSKPQITVIDFKDIVHARARDVMVEPGDIVYVPFTPYRTITRYVDLILNTFARTVGANEGARAVDPNASTVGSSISVGGGSSSGVSIPVSSGSP